LKECVSVVGLAYSIGDWSPKGECGQ
jgi:hypothetical protein